MATQILNYSDEERIRIAERLGKIFGIEDPLRTISYDLFEMETISEDMVLVKVELQRGISFKEAEKILNALPLEPEKEKTDDTN